MKIKSSPKVKTKFDTYPEQVRERLLYLRQLIIASAKKIASINELEETLKWGEPSYLVKKGSTIRIDWKASKPEQYAIYFKCTSKLVSTFREVFPNKFTFEKNRALVFGMDEQLPEEELIQCIAAALQYHQIKNLPLLGIQ